MNTMGTVSRALSILRLIADLPTPIRVKTVAEATGLPMSTSHRLLELLTEGGFVSKQANRQRYGFGVEYYRVSQQIVSRTFVPKIIDPILNELKSQTGESVVLSLYSPIRGSMHYACNLPGVWPVDYSIRLFEDQPVAWGASGLSMLAVLPERSRDEIIERARPSPTTGRPLDRSGLRERLGRVRSEGFATSEGEKIAGAVGIASPIQTRAGTVVGSLCLTIPRERFQKARTASLGGLVRDAAARSQFVLEKAEQLPG